MPTNAVNEQRRLELRREQVLDRLWELAKLGPEITRGSITGQVKALGMIVAIEGLIPDRRANHSEKKSAPPLPQADIYAAAWLGKQRGETIDPQPEPSTEQKEDGPGVAETETTPGWEGNAATHPGTTSSPIFEPSESDFANRFPSSGASWAPNAFDSAPDNRVPFSIKRNPFARGR